MRDYNAASCSSPSTGSWPSLRLAALHVIRSPPQTSSPAWGPGHHISSFLKEHWRHQLVRGIINSAEKEMETFLFEEKVNVMEQEEWVSESKIWFSCQWDSHVPQTRWRFWTLTSSSMRAVIALHSAVENELRQQNKTYGNAPSLAGSFCHHHFVYTFVASGNPLLLKPNRVTSNPAFLLF